MVNLRDFLDKNRSKNIEQEAESLIAKASETCELEHFDVSFEALEKIQSEISSLLSNKELKTKTRLELSFQLENIEAKIQCKKIYRGSQRRALRAIGIDF